MDVLIEIQAGNKMSIGFGITELRILEYLDDKAKRSKKADLKTIKSYANTSEISKQLLISQDVVCQAITALCKVGRIKIYPNGRKRNRYFGSLILPAVTEKEIASR